MSEPRATSHPDRVLWLTLAIAGLLAGVYTWIAWAGGVHDDWHAALLYPSIALVKGMPVYYGATEGPVNNLLYGPVFALFYTPVGVFSSPTPAIVSGMVLSTISFFAPFFFLLLRFGPRQSEDHRREWLLALVGCLFFFFVIYAVPGTRFSALRLKPDGPAMLFMLAAVLRIMTLGKAGPTWARLLTVSVLFQVAFWTKQNNILASVGVILYLWAAYDVKAALRFVVTSAVSGLVFLALWRWVHGPELLFNLVTLAAERPLRVNPPMPDVLYWAGSLWNFIRHGIGVVLWIGFLLAIDPDLKRGSIRQYIRDNRFTVLILMAVAMAPTAFLGYIAVGGSYNSITNLLAPLLLASMFQLYRLCGYDVIGVSARVTAAPIRASTGRSAIAIAALAIALAHADPQNVLSDLARSTRLRDNPQEVAFRYVQAHPGVSYLPWTPLAHLMGEAKLYHFDYGLSDRRLGKHRITFEHFMRHVPPSFEFVAYKDAQDHETLEHFLSNYELSEPVEELPGWDIYRLPRSNFPLD